MSNSALRDDSTGDPLFVRSNREYTREYPAENVVRCDSNGTYLYIVYAHCSRNESGYELHDDETSARERATELYGKQNHSKFTGEIDSVEVHEVLEWNAQEHINAASARLQLSCR